MKNLTPKWQILIPTVVNRSEKFARLRDCLAPQVSKYKGKIEVVVFWNNYERELSELRQLMVETATAEYTNFIDDDDLVSYDYCDQVFPLLDGVDHIGFRLAMNQWGESKKVIHSLSCEKWWDNGQEFFRRATLIDPTKRELMLKAGFRNADYRKNIPEDTAYAQNVDGLLHTENFIDKEIHLYMPTDEHAWQRFEGFDGQFKRPQLPKYFSFHPNSTEEQ